MGTLVRTPASAVWLVLCVLTVLSWVLAAGDGSSGSRLAASLAIIAVAVFKVRLVGLYFMELRNAPTAMRGVFEGYCVVLLGLLVGMFVVG
jgi:caa(3)-type oxidase subunit IV